MSFPGGSQVKNLSTNAGDADYVILCAKIPNLGAVRDVGSIPGSGRSSGEGNGNPLQYSCLENPMTEKPDGLYSPWGQKRVGHNLVTKQQLLG